MSQIKAPEKRLRFKGPIFLATIALIALVILFYMAASVFRTLGVKPSRGEAVAIRGNHRE
jgi:hypothetical protein